MKKLDLIKLDKGYYTANSSPKLMVPRKYRYLMVGGISSPEAPVFSQSITALYAVAYAIKFHYKSIDLDFVVPKMEGQWWVTGELPFEETPREQWNWNIMIPMPDYVSEDIFQQMRSVSYKKKQLAQVLKVEFSVLNEGSSVQILHLGSYQEEKASIDKIMSFLGQEGLEIAGYHHEIYLTDPTRTPEHKLKTIIRYPVTNKK